jgi:hypothetical protein
MTSIINGWVGMGVGVGVGVAVGVAVDEGVAVGVLVELSVAPVGVVPESPIPFSVAGSGMEVELEVSPTTTQAASADTSRRKLSEISGCMVRFIYHPCATSPDYRALSGRAEGWYADDADAPRIYAERSSLFFLSTSIGVAIRIIRVPLS